MCDCSKLYQIVKSVRNDIADMKKHLPKEEHQRWAHILDMLDMIAMEIKPKG